MVDFIPHFLNWINGLLSFQVAGISMYALVLLPFIIAAIKLFVDAVTTK